MREKAMDPLSGRRQTALNAWRFGPLCRLGYRVSGRDGKGFTAIDLASGKEIRRLTFDVFSKAVKTAGMTRSARARLLTKRATPEHRLREQIEHQRLHLLARERREVCPTKRTPTRGTSPHD